MKPEYINLERKLGKQVLKVLDEAVHSILRKENTLAADLNFLRNQEIGENGEKLKFREIQLHAGKILLMISYETPQTGRTHHYVASMGSADKELRKMYPNGAIVKIDTGTVDCYYNHLKSAPERIARQRGNP